MRKLPTFLLSLCSAFAALIFLSISVTGQGVAPTCASITVSNLTYTQDFDTLANSGTGSIVPPGFGFAETGTNANTTYTAGTGSSATGDTFSFGAVSSTERAFGGLRSGSLVPTIGACFTNNIGGTINSIQITYDGEQWRLGTAGRQDRLDFQYSLNAASLTDATATWIDVDALDFSTPNTAAPTGAKDGNAAENRTPGIAALIIPLSIPNGATVYIRFLDVEASGSDDGLAIDNFSFTPSILTAASATISGRITTSAGRGLNLVTVTLTGGNLSETKYAVTNHFGYYRFTDVQVGEGYVVTVKSKRYIFRQPSIFIGVNQDLTGVDFIGEMRK
jgi:hypothetical protein